MSPTTTMTPSGESPREARRPTALSSRKNTLIGTWNVRTMYESGRCDNVTREMDRYKIQLLGLTETRWIGPERKS